VSNNPNGKQQGDPAKVKEEPWIVIPPEKNYLGLSYGEWAARWFNWLISPDPDLHNNGPVVFLRGVDFELRNGSYRHFIRIGKQRIKISLNQAIFWPVICHFVDEKMVPTLDDPQKRLTDVFNGAIGSDYPPDKTQATVDGKPIKENLTDHFIISPDFVLHVPEPTYGQSLGSVFQIPIVYPGDWRAVVCGYFIMIKPPPTAANSGRSFIIASNGNAEDRYHTETFVEVEVNDEKPQNRWEGQLSSMREIIQDEIRRQTGSVGEERQHPVLGTFPQIADKYNEYNGVLQDTHPDPSTRKSHNT
jgi:hypothetical protein